MYEDIKSYPKQFLKRLHAVNADRLAGLAGGWSGRLYLAGMGGSSLPGDLINDYLQGRFQLQMVKGYNLPSGAPPDSVLICSSYSGNTEETLSALEEGLARQMRLVVLAHGGILHLRARELGLPLLEVPESIQPRCASGYFFMGILEVLERLGVVPATGSETSGLAAFLDKSRDRHESAGIALAKALKGRVPVIYGPDILYGACQVWKIKMNENAKVQSFFNVFPEVNHNEMVGYTNLLMSPSIIYLKSRFMHPRIRRRMDVMREILSAKIPFHSLELEGESLLQDVFDAHAFADYASYYLAAEYGVDPAPVEMVESFKKKLG